ncbi:MAG: class I SAM-dependent methyltransferase [Chloroflexota bacterium]
MRTFIRKFFPRLFFRLFYLGTPPWDSGITPPELEEFIQNHPPGRAIDLGCGTGTNVITLTQHGWQVSGVDFVPKAILQARRKARLAGIHSPFFIGDVTDSSFFQGNYDLILDIGCYHALSAEQRHTYRHNLRQHLAPSGTFLLYAFTGEETASNRFTPKDLAAFQRDFSLHRREDDFDGGGPTSAWFWFQHKQS